MMSLFPSTKGPRVVGVLACALSVVHLAGVQALEVKDESTSQSAEDETGRGGGTEKAIVRFGRPGHGEEADATKTLVLEGDSAGDLKVIMSGEKLIMSGGGNARGKRSDGDDKGRLEADGGAESKFYVGLMCGGVIDEALRAHLRLPEGKGVIVDRVIQDSPADKAGFKIHDVIVTMNAKELTGPADVIAAVAASEGKPIEVKIIRGGSHKTLTVTPNERPANMARGIDHEVMAAGDAAVVQQWIQSLPNGVEGPIRFRVFGPGVQIRELGQKGSGSDDPEGMEVTITGDMIVTEGTVDTPPNVGRELGRPTRGKGRAAKTRGQGSAPSDTRDDEAQGEEPGQGIEDGELTFMIMGPDGVIGQFQHPGGEAVEVQDVLVRWGAGLEVSPDAPAAEVSAVLQVPNGKRIQKKSPPAEDRIAEMQEQLDQIQQTLRDLKRALADRSKTEK